MALNWSYLLEGIPGKCRLVILILGIVSFFFEIIGHLVAGNGVYPVTFIILVAIYLATIAILVGLNVFSFSGIIVLVDMIVCLVFGFLSLILGIVALAEGIKYINASNDYGERCEGRVRANYDRFDDRREPYYGNCYQSDIYLKWGIFFLLSMILCVVHVVLCILIAISELKGIKAGEYGEMSMAPARQGGQGGQDNTSVVTALTLTVTAAALLNTRKP